MHSQLIAILTNISTSHSLHMRVLLPLWVQAGHPGAASSGTGGKSGLAEICALGQETASGRRVMVYFPPRGGAEGVACEWQSVEGRVCQVDTHNGVAVVQASSLLCPLLLLRRYLAMSFSSKCCLVIWPGGPTLKILASEGHWHTCQLDEVAQSVS